MLKSDAQTLYSSRGRGGSDRWYTPPWILDRLQTIRQTKWYDPFPQEWSGRRDGFRHVWPGRFVYVNPPYSQLFPAAQKGLRELRRRPDQLQVWLIPSRTETRAFHALLSHMAQGGWPVLFFSRRVQFVGPYQSGENAPFPSALLAVAGPFVRDTFRGRFLAAFGTYGRALIVTDYQNL